MKKLDQQTTKTDTSPDSSSDWNKDETQRFMDTLLKAQRARKAKEAASTTNVTKNLDKLLEAATRERQLAEVDLKLKQQEILLAEIETKLKDDGKV